MAAKWYPLPVVPADAIDARPQAHFARGKPERIFEIHGADGLMAYLYRFTGSDGRKVDVALSWCVNEQGTSCEWRWVLPATPRPLYGPRKLAWQTNPDSAIIVTDDPASVDAGHALLPTLKCASFSGGASAIKKTDWSVLDGRTVVLFPTVDEVEGDQPNLRAMKQLATVLVKNGCSVKMVDVAGLTPGFNLAAAQEANWDSADTMAWLSERARLVFSNTVFQGAKGKPTPKIANADHGAEWRDHIQLVYRKGEIAECRENVIEFLLHHPDWRGVLAWDEFAYKVVKRKPPPFGGPAGDWIDSDFISLGIWLSREEDLLVRAMDVLVKAVLFVAEKAPFHPVREMLKSAKWDGTPRIDKWLPDFLGADENEYTALVGRFFFINMVRRVMEPGCIMRSVLVLVGGQNMGKSTALATIGGQWFADTMFVVGDKDAYQVLRNKWLYEIAEFHSFGKAEATRVKAFVSSAVDTFRASYGTSARDWPRQVCFCASTNQFEFLRDPTGNTRFDPVHCREINTRGLRDVRDQLFAEAYHRYLAGERAHPTPEQEQLIYAPVRETHEVGDAWQTDIVDWIRKHRARKVTIREVLYECLGFEQSKLTPAHGETLRVVSILQRIGCKKERESTGARQWYYRVPDELIDPSLLDVVAGRKSGTDDDNDPLD